MGKTKVVALGTLVGVALALAPLSSAFADTRFNRHWGHGGNWGGGHGNVSYAVRGGGYTAVTVATAASGRSAWRLWPSGRSLPRSSTPPLRSSHCRSSLSTLPRTRPTTRRPRLMARRPPRTATRRRLPTTTTRRLPITRRPRATTTVRPLRSTTVRPQRRLITALPLPITRHPRAITLSPRRITLRLRSITLRLRLRRRRLTTTDRRRTTTTRLRLLQATTTIGADRVGG